MKIGMISLGCPKNQVDGEVMLGLLKEAGHELVSDLNTAETIIVNTCGFINDAKEESVNEILEAASYKESGRCNRLIVTGCLAQRYSNEIMEQIPEVDAVIGSAGYGNIVEALEDSKQSMFFPELDNYEEPNTERVLTTNKGMAYLKIAEGCDNHCTYCIIPKLRGPFRSRTIENLKDEAKGLANQGVKELILVAQDTTRYGVDLYGTPSLVDLIRHLSDIEGIRWIRLLYCYPELVDDALIKEFKTNLKLCKYIDIPMQHASDTVLKRMGRSTDKAMLQTLVNKLRSEVPEISIRSTMIVGFPGETEEDFQELYSFVEMNRFERMGVFVYSKEEGTPAEKLKPQIKKSIAKERHNKLMELQNGISLGVTGQMVGKYFAVLVENVAEDGIFYMGRSQWDAPGIDGVVYFTSPFPLEAGQFVNVRVLNNDDYDLIGEVTDESAE